MCHIEVSGGAAAAKETWQGHPAARPLLGAIELDREPARHGVPPRDNCRRSSVDDVLAGDVAGSIAAGGWFLAEELNSDLIVVRLARAWRSIAPAKAPLTVR